MAVYVTKKCPHCGFAYQVFKSGDQRKYGCPYKMCPMCSKYFWDTDIVEPALHGYENSYETKQSINRAITIILYIPAALLMLIGGIFSLIYGMMIGIVGIVMGAIIIFIMVLYFKQKINDRKNMDAIIAERKLEYDKSMERLKDTTYLTELAKFDKRAKELLNERINGYTEHYARRP